MLLAATLAAAVILGLIRGGRLTNLTRVKLMHPWLVFLSVLLSALLLFLSMFDVALIRPLVMAALLLQYLLLLLFIWYNRHLHYTWVIALGSFLNGLVILLNGGTMPLADLSSYVASDSELANQFLISGNLPLYHIVHENTLLWFLGDVIRIPHPFSSMISIGDIILYAGVFLLLQHLVAGTAQKKKQPL
ncbi:MAG: DUF5317 family protein [Caldicoprobacterales bacterium]|jgi:hypothetical protein|nr:DUF5317 domain-containing protein [Clostridiales bacterium]